MKISDRFHSTALPVGCVNSVRDLLDCDDFRPLKMSGNHLFVLESRSDAARFQPKALVVEHESNVKADTSPFREPRPEESVGH